MSEDRVTDAGGQSASAGLLDDAALRSGIYAVLARGFSFPDENFREFFSRGGEMASGLAADMSGLVGALSEAADSASMDELQQAHSKLFDPIRGPFPYETEQRKLQDFSKAQILADVMGFYRAFGVEPRGERGDHIVSELDFMHLLVLKEGHALSGGLSDKAALCRETQEEFFREHVGSWIGELVVELRACLGSDGNAFHARLVDLLQLFIEGEKESLS